MLTILSATANPSLTAVQAPPASYLQVFASFKNAAPAARTDDTVASRATWAGMKCTDVKASYQEDDCCPHSNGGHAGALHWENTEALVSKIEMCPADKALNAYATEPLRAHALHWATGPVYPATATLWQKTFGQGIPRGLQNCPGTMASFFSAGNAIAAKDFDGTNIVFPAANVFCTIAGQNVIAALVDVFNFELRLGWDHASTTNFLGQTVVLNTLNQLEIDGSPVYNNNAYNATLAARRSDVAFDKHTARELSRSFFTALRKLKQTMQAGNGGTKPRAYDLLDAVLVHTLNVHLGTSYNLKFTPAGDQYFYFPPESEYACSGASGMNLAGLGYPLVNGYHEVPRDKVDGNVLDIAMSPPEDPHPGPMVSLEGFERTSCVMGDGFVGGMFSAIRGQMLAIPNELNSYDLVKNPWNVETVPTVA